MKILTHGNGIGKGRGIKSEILLYRVGRLNKKLNKEMKKKIMKSTLAVALVAAAAFGGAKTYGAYAGATESDQLLAENIEALSTGGESPGKEGCQYRSLPCYRSAGSYCGTSSQTQFDVCCTQTNCR